MNYLLRRLLMMIPTLFLVSTLVFSFVHLIPGDPVDLILGEQAVTADREAFRKRMKLDLPLHEQYFSFLTGLLKGDLGTSLFERREVTDLLRERIPATLQLAFASLVIALTFSLAGGTFAAIRQNSFWDRTTLLYSLIGISMPNFWLGPLLILLFSITLGLFPVSGREELGSLILPALTLGIGMSAILTRMIRSSMIETLKEDYIRTAYAKGVSPARVFLRHALRNALNPVVTVVGLQLGNLLAGAIVTEKIFAWPGVGSLVITAIERRDYPVLQGAILLIAFTYSFMNLITDLAYGKLDPRIRLA